MNLDRKKRLLLLTAVISLLFVGCGNEELKPVKSGQQEQPVAVESIVPVRAVDEFEGKKVLLVPKSALVHKGELTGILVVEANNRLSLRWIRTGRSTNGDLVVLGGLDKGEFVVGIYNPALHEGVTVKKSPRVTKEVQSK